MKLYESVYSLLDKNYDINVLKGNKKELEEDIYLLEDAFYQVCGFKYQSLVSEISNINIYQCENSEDLNETLRYIFPDIYEDGSKGKKRNGEFLTLSNGEKFIFLGPDKDEKLRILAHELFVHALSSITNNVFKFNGQLYERIGIRYNNVRTNEVKNEILNEGFAVYYEDKIVGKIDEGLARKHIVYGDSQEVVEVIENNMAERKIFNFLYDGVPIDSFFSKKENEVLRQVSTNLDKKFNLYINKDNIDQNIFDENYDKVSRAIESDKKELVYCMKRKMKY